MKNFKNKDSKGEKMVGNSDYQIEDFFKFFTTS